MKDSKKPQGRPVKWGPSRENRIRPEGMTRNEWRKLGGKRRRLIIMGITAALMGVPDGEA